ncbi:AAA family ATPase [Neolewinella sp.]|uniref:ATP-binding protein n=1 Tax=Neolewinella sp. TaxID=2993543 RepID=UPI003B52BF8B
MLKYPIGIQDFRTLREGGYAYVDKTEHIHRLLTTGKYYFFSRPRRFGKSLTVATMNELYSGSRELFDGLWVQDHWDFGAMRRPVVWLKFASSGFRTQGLEAALHNLLDDAAKLHGVELSQTSFDRKFHELLQILSTRGRVVLLIDEYDKPIIDYLDDLPQAEANRDLLKSFYSVIKDSDPFLELVFITGVSAFSKVSIFSDLNHLRNLSLSPQTNTLVGITEAELDHYFGPVLASVDRAQLRRWYNGYSWTGEQTVYNPFSLLNFLADGVYRNYWFETGTPTFLVEALRDRQLYPLGELELTQQDIGAFDISRLETYPLLFQTGYLTVIEAQPAIGSYRLDFPNLEVKQSLEEMLLRAYASEDPGNPRSRVLTIYHALSRKDIDSVTIAIDSVLANVPYDLWQRDDERTFHTLVHLLFSLLGVIVQSEVHTARGRCDALVLTDDYVYAFEFKVNATAQAALDQIEARGYLAPYADDPREKVAVGISFDRASRRIGAWAAD